MSMYGTQKYAKETRASSRTSYSEEVYRKPQFASSRKQQGRLGFQKCQEIGVELVLVGGKETMWRARIYL